MLLFCHWRYNSFITLQIRAWHCYVLIGCSIGSLCNHNKWSVRKKLKVICRLILIWKSKRKCEKNKVLTHIHHQTKQQCSRTKWEDKKWSEKCKEARKSQQTYIKVLFFSSLFLFSPRISADSALPSSHAENLSPLPLSPAHFSPYSV